MNVVAAGPGGVVGPCDMEGPLQVKVGSPGDDRVAVQVNVIIEPSTCVGLTGVIRTLENVAEKNNITSLHHIL